VKQGTYMDGASVGERCSIGPFAHLRPGSVIGDECRVGNFVEIKKSVLGARTRASHLSYIGDAEIGSDVNLGCGFVTCNYSGGEFKNKTVIEDGVFVGSDSQTVAPVRVGAGSMIASGTTVTEDVPPDSLVISRGRQVTKPGYAKKYRQGV
jgi:bifunctional UDP-N-acetylglucosamine pyrophosphorylase/glucosamine-1-phosphate N-acetyltransferase